MTSHLHCRLQQTRAKTKEWGECIIDADLIMWLCELLHWGVREQSNFVRTIFSIENGRSWWYARCARTLSKCFTRLVWNHLIITLYNYYYTLNIIILLCNPYITEFAMHPAIALIAKTWFYEFWIHDQNGIKMVEAMTGLQTCFHSSRNFRVKSCIQWRSK